MTDSFAARLRAMIEADSMPVLPGAYDGVSARLIARAGFPAIYYSGGLSASSFPGVPDFGTRSLSEAVAQVGGAVRATGLPVLADGEAGFGSVLSVERLVGRWRAWVPRGCTSKTRTCRVAAVTTATSDWSAPRRTSAACVRRWIL